MNGYRGKLYIRDDIIKDCKELKTVHMEKQQEVIIEAIFNLGKLVKQELDIEEVRNLLGVNQRKEEIEAEEELSKQVFTFTGKRLSDTESLHKNPGVHLTDLDAKVHIRECHIDDTYKFSEDGRVYDEFLNGYIKPEVKNKQNTVQIMLNRTVINMSEDFVRYYAITTDTKHANKLLDDALEDIRSSSDKAEIKRKKELDKIRLQKERESQSERYNYHTKTQGMHLAHTPYILTEEGRVFDTELGKLRAVNNRGYTTSLTKGFTVPINLSIKNIKDILEKQDFTSLIERTNYTEYQCIKMWEDYQKTLQLKEEPVVQEDSIITKDPEIDEVAEKAGFIRMEDGYYIHKSQI